MNDEQLINQAESIPYFRWYEIQSLIDMAEKEETKRILEGIERRKYHTEEFHSGML